MFTRKPKTNVGLDTAITKLQLELLDHNGDSNEYAAISGQLSDLYALKKLEPSRSVSPDTAALIAANLTTTLLVLHYEQAHVIATKAFGFVAKLR